jgi:hypothetical protein
MVLMRRAGGCRREADRIQHDIGRCALNRVELRDPNHPDSSQCHTCHAGNGTKQQRVIHSVASNTMHNLFNKSVYRNTQRDNRQLQPTKGNTSYSSTTCPRRSEHNQPTLVIKKKKKATQVSSLEILELCWASRDTILATAQKGLQWPRNWFQSRMFHERT